MKRRFVQIVLFLVFVSGVIGSILLIDKFKTTNKRIETKKEKEIHSYRVSGAVLHTGIHKSLKKLTYRELFFIVKVKDSSDLSGFKLNTYPQENKEIFVPYKMFKLKWIEFENIKQLSHLNISKSILNNLLKHRKENIRTTWANIQDISAIGEKTIEKLKNILILD
ncbi:MAG0490 family ComEA-like DNA-binding protein [Mycoplasmopsis edwardii]|uniref:Uncharacterized protein n=1 Tax=Mycoplasmopsis edwardii TaxID=53558 RepID=A0ACD4PGS9_9BACT|nr:hypothetical protein [Mycoplasmopsis edwardii]WBP83859.1 hypothetical protein Me_995_000485 [Mycoplasmopsis edwardii]